MTLIRWFPPRKSTLPLRYYLAGAFMVLVVARLLGAWS